MNNKKMSFLGDQEKVYDEVVGFLQNKEYGIGLIKGAAGFGKTVLVGMVIEYLVKAEYGTIGMLAPTGQAVRVCRNSIGVNSTAIKYGTIHSAFAMFPKKDSEVLKFVQQKGRKIWAYDCDILIVDKVSQLEDKLFFYIQEYAEKKNTKIIFVGDKFQIPPIGQEYSIPFSKNEVKEYNIIEFELTKPIRQLQGNPILNNADFIRENINTSGKLYLPEDRFDEKNALNQSVVFHSTKGLDVTKLVKEWFLSDKYKNNTLYIKVITYRRSTAAKWNTLIRKILYGDLQDNIVDIRSGDIKKIVIGERLILRKPLVEKSEIGEDRPILRGNEELKVLSFEMDTYDVDGTGSYKIKYYDTVISYINEFGNKDTQSVKIVHEDSERIYEDVKNLLAKSANAARKGSVEHRMYWDEFWGFVGLFADVGYDYARTCHTAEGSTYKNTIVLEWDILVNFNILERNRILYVGCTRATDNVIQIY